MYRFRFRTTLFFTILLFAVSALAQVQFSKSELPTGTRPSDVILGDINGDKLPDLITVDSGDRTISVRLNNGDGTFAPRSTFTTGSANPLRGSTADFQKDGKTDVVVINPSASSVSVLLGRGDGTFSAPKTFTTGTNPQWVAAGDFNGDGKTDIVTANSGSNNITVLPGNGDGTFGALKVIGTLSHAPSAMTKGDFNGDGRLDIAVTECCQGTDVAYDTLFTFLNQGNWSFSKKTGPDMPTSDGIASAKLNSDAYDDLVQSYLGCHTPCEGVDAYKGNGDGTFTKLSGMTIDVLTYVSPTVPVIADFNKDGRKDIAVAVRYGGEGTTTTGHDQLLIWLRNSDGSYPTRASTMIDLGQGRTPAAVSAKDLSKDGLTDLAVAANGTNTAIVLKNSTTSSGSGGTCQIPSSNGVVICAPSDGATVASPVHITAAAKSSAAIDRMNIWVDGSKLYQVHSNTLDTSLAMANGKHRVTVQAVDVNGTILNKTIYITVGQSSTGCTASTAGVNICTPADGATVSSPVHITAAAKSTVAIDRMNVWVDGAKDYEVHAASIDTSLAMTTGQHRVTVQAVDNAGNVYHQTVYISVTNGSTSCTATTTGVHICSPTDGATVSSPVHIVAAAEGSNSIARMNVWVDGNKVYEVHQSSIDTSLAMSTGQHRVTVQAVDNNARIYNQTIYITVQ